MPFTIWRGSLTAVVSGDLNGLGPSESEPVVIPWAWYYHLPQFAGWTAVLALLLLRKPNRVAQAWAILIPFFLLSEIAVPWLCRLPNVRDNNLYDLPMQWFVVAWATLLLAADWLARRRPLVRLVLTFAWVMLVAVAAQMGSTGYWQVGVFFVQCYAMPVATLVLAFLLARFCCRRRYRPRRFMVWLLVWLLAWTSAGCCLLFAYILFTVGRLGSDFARLGSQIAVVSGGTAAIVYLLILPFMILVFRNALYRERFQNLLRLGEDAAAPPATTLPDVTLPHDTTPAAAEPKSALENQ